jgi:hypothetical protein
MRIQLLLVLSTLSFLACIAAEPSAATPQTGAPSAQTDPVYSVAWTPRELRVKQFYTTAPYNCDYLYDDLTRLLLQLGARASDLKVDIAPCYKRVREEEWFVRAEVKFSVLGPADTTAQNAASESLQAHWKTIDIALDTSPRKQVLTSTRLNHYTGLGFRNRNMIILLKSQILPLFLLKSVEFRDDGASLHAEVLAPVEDPTASH